MTSGEKPDGGRGPRKGWTPELGEAFLALLRETGNARASARALGPRHWFLNRMRRDHAYRADCQAAVREADARLAGAASPFLPPLERKAMPPDGDRPAEPGREPVIRRTCSGRLQISHVRDGDWTSKTEADFLARLRETGNLRASARAVGAHPSTVFNRIAQWPAFAKDCRDACDEAAIRLDYALVAHAHALLRRPGERALDEDPDEDARFDPDKAMRILAFLDRRRAGRTTRGPRKGPPERSFDEAVASVLAKIEAIERHRKLEAEREADKPKPDGDAP